MFVSVDDELGEINDDFRFRIRQLRPEDAILINSGKLELVECRGRFNNGHLEQIQV